MLRNTKEDNGRGLGTKVANAKGHVMLRFAYRCFKLLSGGESFLQIGHFSNLGIQSVQTKCPLVHS